MIFTCPHPLRVVLLKLSILCMEHGLEELWCFFLSFRFSSDLISYNVGLVLCSLLFDFVGRRFACSLARDGIICGKVRRWVRPFGVAQH